MFYSELIILRAPEISEEVKNLCITHASYRHFVVGKTKCC